MSGLRSAAGGWYRRFVGWVERSARTIEIGIFVMGVLLYLVVQVGLTARIHLAREAPPEPDDAYGRIWAAARIGTCLIQRCPAVEDLSLQSTVPPDDAGKHGAQWNMAHRVLNFYTPIYSFSIAGVRGLGLSWEDSFTVIAVAIGVVTGLAAAYLMWVLFGPGPAGLGMFTLAWTFASGHEYYSTPSQLALGLGMAVWACILQTGRRAPPVLIGTAILLLIHPIGVLWTVITLALYMTQGNLLRYTRRELIVIAACLAMVVGMWIVVPSVIDYPVIRATYGSNASTLPGLDWLNSVRGNLVWARRYVWRFVGSPFGVPIYEPTLRAGASILMLGFILVDMVWFVRHDPRGRRTGTLVLITLGFLAVTIFHVVPGYSAVSFQRTFELVGPIFAGLVGHTVWQWIRLSGKGLGEWLDWLPGHGERPGTLATAAVVTSGVIIAVCLGQTVFYGNRRLQNLEQATVAENLIFPDPTQVALLLEDATPGDKVLYFSGTYRDLYLSYGAYQLGAVYYPAIEGTAQEETWLSDESLSYVTASSPVYSLIGSDHGPNAWGRLYLRKIDGLDIVSQDMERLGDLRLDISNPGETFSITIDVMQHAQLQRSVEVTVPAGHEGWLDLPAECASATTLRLDLSHASREAYLAGLQNASGQTTLNWPWDQGIELVVTYRDGETDTMRFDTSRRFRTELYGREVQVLADRGSIVLAKILR